MRTDFQETGKLYPKLDAYKGYSKTLGQSYIGSSCQFKTMKKYKEWLVKNYAYFREDLTIRRGEA